MKGLELSKKYFEAYGRELIENAFAPYKERIAAGLVGQGSERYGFDDDISHDHDFCAGFCLWISKEDDALFGFDLQKAYRHLADRFLGFPTHEKERTGISRYGVMTYDAFFEPLVGTHYQNLTADDYLYTPSHYFADATNGEIFYDNGGAFTKIYTAIKYGMPEDIRLKKLAANLAGMAQAGQYNYARTLLHGEEGAAVLALNEFVRLAAHTIYLLNRCHAPFYKWLLRGLRDLPLLGHLAPSFEYLLTGDNDKSSRVTKSEVIEDICAAFILVLTEQGLSKETGAFLEAHARSVTASIHDIGLRNLHLLAGLS